MNECVMAFLLVGYLIFVTFNYFMLDYLGKINGNLEYLATKVKERDY